MGKGKNETRIKILIRDRVLYSKIHETILQQKRTAEITNGPC